MKKPVRSSLFAPALVAAALSAAVLSPSQAGTTTTVAPATDKYVLAEPASERSTMDKIWDLATLYKSDDGFLNELSLTGRYQGQFWDADSDQGQEDGWDNRRFRIGSRAYFLDRKVGRHRHIVFFCREIILIKCINIINYE